MTLCRQYSCSGAQTFPVSTVWICCCGSLAHRCQYLSGEEDVRLSSDCTRLQGCDQPGTLEHSWPLSGESVRPFICDSLDGYFSSWVDNYSAKPPSTRPVCIQRFMFKRLKQKISSSSSTSWINSYGHQLVCSQLPLVTELWTLTRPHLVPEEGTSVSNFAAMCDPNHCSCMRHGTLKKSKSGIFLHHRRSVLLGREPTVAGLSDCFSFTFFRASIKKK